jgi:hypothetical protein
MTSGRQLPVRGGLAALRVPAMAIASLIVAVGAIIIALASERAWLDGTVRRDREGGQIANAIWEDGKSRHDPVSFGSGDR